jgi:uncharacterized membrane protein
LTHSQPAAKGVPTSIPIRHLAPTLSRIVAVLAAGICLFAAGCSDSPASNSCPNDYPASCPTGAATFAAGVAPLVQTRCAFCHAPGKELPTLDGYANIYSAGPHILTQLTHCPALMPPAPFQPLSSDERRVILSWFACGAMND